MKATRHGAHRYIVFLSGLLSGICSAQSIDSTFDDLCTDLLGPSETYSGIFPQGVGIICVGGGFVGELVISSADFGSTFIPTDNLTSAATSSASNELSRDVIADRIKEVREEPTESMHSDNAYGSTSVTDRLGIFLSGRNVDGERQQANYANNYDPAKCWGEGDRLCSDSNTYGAEFDQDNILLGMDYRFTDIIVGAAISSTSGKVESNYNRSNSEFENYQLNLFYSMELPLESYVDLLIGFGKGSISYQRDFSFSARVGGLGLYDFPDDVIPIRNFAEADTDTGSLSASLGFGKNIAIKSFSILPQFSFNWLSTNVDKYRENAVDLPGDATIPQFSNPSLTANLDEQIDPLEDMVMANFLLDVQEQDIGYLSSNVGIDVSYALSTGMGILSPSFGLEWIHQFNDETEVDSSFLYQSSAGEKYSFETRSSDIDNDFCRAELGFVFTLPRSVSTYILLEQYFWNNDIDMKSFNIGIRIQI